MAISLPNRLLSVDLSDRTVTEEPVPPAWLEAFLGGKGLGARYLYDAVGPDVAPLSPRNVLLLLVGPLTGYLPGDDRFAAVTKSPLTGLFLDSYAGGSFPTAFRASMQSHVGIRITGAAETTHVLDLRGDEPRLTREPALAGTEIDEVDHRYPEASVVAVGPAGEHGVAYATIATDGGDHHAGRGGAGAVMGSKGLKAIVVPESTALSPPNDRIRTLQEETRERYADSAFGAAHGASGTLESVAFADALSMLPTHGWREQRFEGADDLGLAAVRQASTGRERPEAAIKGDFRIDEESGETVMRGGTPIALGATLGIDEFDAVATLGATCDHLGLDVISAGSAIALAILASERGRVDRAFSFGDPDAARQLLEEIATRSTPLGETLAAGVESAAASLGMTAAIPTVKSMAVPSFDPRGVPAMALAYATSDRGACHRRAVPVTAQVSMGRRTPTQTARAIAAEQDRRALLWCLIVDDVMTPLFPDLGSAWLDALGYSIGPDRLRRIGTRTWTLTRLFNVREGVDREADALPAVFRAGDEPGVDLTTFRRTLDRYYEIREWDQRGRPSRRLLERLDLEGLLDDRTPVGDPPLHGPADPTITRTGADE